MTHAADAAKECGPRSRTLAAGERTDGGTRPMELVGVETSPLRAAREWRGISLVAAARASGLHLAQAEALEDGRGDAFETVEEMVASAVLYGAMLGVGRDEAMALLDRAIAGGGTAIGTPPQVDEPTEEEAGAGITIPSGTAA